MNEIFEKIYREGFSTEQFQTAINTDAQRNFERFVEKNVENTSYEAYFHPENFPTSVREKLMEVFRDAMEEGDDLNETFDYLYDVIDQYLENHNMSDEADDMVDAFGKYVSHQIGYSNLQECYADSAEISCKPVRHVIDDEWDKMKDWEAESKEFSSRYKIA